MWCALLSPYSPLRSSRLRVALRVFFFSSRRRHTRCLSDWSSDVCSSDLGKPLADAFASGLPRMDCERSTTSAKIGRASCRERCRSRWPQYHQKKKQNREEKDG